MGNSKSLITKLTRLDDKNYIQAREFIEAIREITSITKTFCCMYEKVDGIIRKKLYELRSSWDPIWPIRMPNITPDKKSSPNINTRENKRRFNRAMIVGSYVKKYNEGMYALDTFELMNTSLTMDKNLKKPMLTW